MTAALRDDNTPRSPFSDWIRGCVELDSREFNLSVQDNDLWVHRFSARKEVNRTEIKRLLEHIQLIEVKTFNAHMPFAQRDTFDVIDQVIRQCSVKASRRKVITIRDRRQGRSGSPRKVRWLGVHLLQMSGDRPDSSERMLWDGKTINETMLIELLRFDRDPDSPGVFLDTRRHHRRSDKEQLPQLFVVGGNKT